MNKVILLIFISVVALDTKAQIADYPIDWKYHAGEFLLFDCERGHYACVDRDGDDNCREERNYARDKKLPKYPCASLRKFETKKKCVQEQYKIQDIGAQKRFCFPH